MKVNEALRTVQDLLESLGMGKGCAEYDLLDQVKETLFYAAGEPSPSQLVVTS